MMFAARNWDRATVIRERPEEHVETSISRVEPCDDELALRRDGMSNKKKGGFPIGNSALRSTGSNA